MEQSRTSWTVKQSLILVSCAIFAGLLVFVLYSTRLIVLAALIGIGLGVLVSPVMSLLRDRYRIPRGVSAVLMVILIFGGIGGIGYGSYILIWDQLQQFIERFPELFATVQKQFSTLLAGKPWIAEQINQLELGRYTRMAAGILFSGIQTTVTAIGGIFVILAIGLYTAINLNSYFRGFLSLFPAYLRPKTQDVLREAASSLRRWFKGQLIVMAVIGSATMLGLWILGIEYWLLLGFLTAIFGFIPYVGAFFTGALTALVTLGTAPEKIWWVLALYVAIQQLEGDLVVPIVMRGAIQLPEVHLIVLMLVMGSLFGLIGVFVAPPFLAVGRSIYLQTYLVRMNRATEAPESRDRGRSRRPNQGRPQIKKQREWEKSPAPT